VGSEPTFGLPGWAEELSGPEEAEVKIGAVDGWVGRGVVTAFLPRKLWSSGRLVEEVTGVGETVLELTVDMIT
jgi:hypothetical protein